MFPLSLGGGANYFSTEIQNISFEEILKCDKVETYNLDPTPRLIFGLVNVN